MTDEQHIAPAAEVAAKVVDGEAVLIHLSTGAYYSLENVGGRIWELIDGGLALDRIAEVVAAEYGAPRERVSADLASLVQQLRDEQLVTESNGGGSEVPVSTRPPSAALEYQPPELNVFRDMADLFALDPPLPELKDEWRDRDETQS